MCLALGEAAIAVLLLALADAIQRDGFARVSLLAAAVGAIGAATLLMSRFDDPRLDHDDPAFRPSRRLRLGRRLASALIGFSAMLVVAGAFVAAAHAHDPASPSGSESADAEVPEKCGTQRWAIKTASDPQIHDVLPQAREASSVAKLALIGRPPKVGYGRVTQRTGSAEHTVYAVTARLETAHVLPDHDIHLVIADRRSGKQMVVELVDVACDGPDRSPFRDRMFEARRSFESACGQPTTKKKALRGTAHIEGIGFWDKPNHASGTLDNGLELHPVLAFHARSCATE